MESNGIRIIESELLLFFFLLFLFGGWGGKWESRLLVSIDFDLDDATAMALYGVSLQELEEEFIFIDTNTVFIGLWTTCYDLSEALLNSFTGRVNSQFCQESDFSGLVI